MAGSFWLMDDDFDIGELFANDAGGLESIHARHRNVHQDQRWAQSLRLFNPLESVRRFPADVPLRAGRKNRAKSPADGLVVVDDENMGSAQIFTVQDVHVDVSGGVNS